jgi:hypothetical protein
LPLSFIPFSEANAMVSKHELRSYQDEDDRRWASRNFVLGSAAAVLMMAVAAFVLTPKPSVGHGGVDISASRRHSDAPFALMNRASRNLPAESWEPAF